MKILLSASAAFFASAISVMAQTYEVDIVGYGTAENFFEPLSGDLMVTRSSSSIERFEGLQSTPLAGMTATCFGSTTILRGIVDGSGNCVFTDPSGDKVLQAWTVDEIGEGFAAGTWRFIGGTGRHQGVKGRGHFTQETNALTGSKVMSIIGVAQWIED